MTNQKIALAACSGMSPVGLVSRVAAADTREKEDNVISICMGATSADREGFQGLIKKYPIIALNGCEGECVNQILAQRDVKPVKTINVLRELNQEGLQPTDVSRLDEEGEKCVQVIQKKIKEVTDEIYEKKV